MREIYSQDWYFSQIPLPIWYIQSRSLSTCNSIKTFDFPTLYKTIPHSKLMDKLRELVQLCLMKKNDHVDILCVRKRHILFCRTPLWFCQEVLWNWYIQHAHVFDWQHICYIWWTCFQDSRHTYGYKLCSSYRRFVPLFLWGRPHTGASQEKRKEASPTLQFHVPLYIWCPFTK